MRSKKEVLQEHYGVESVPEAQSLMFKDWANEGPIPVSQATKLKLPYEALSHPDIPSIEEIERAIVDVEHQLTPRGQASCFPCNVCRIGKTAIKRSEDTMIVQEAEDMLFLQANSQVRTPTVYAVFSHHKDGDEFPTYYLVMEYMEGDTLGTLKWKGISEQDKATICTKLAEQFRLLRSVPSEGYYGRVHHQSWSHRIGSIRLRNKPGGPYDTYEDLTSAMYKTAELSSAMCTDTKEYSPKRESALSEMKFTLEKCGAQRPILTHLDPHLRNIIARRLPGTENDNSDWEVTLIDWQHMGWLPAYMQSVALDQRVYRRLESDTGLEETMKFVDNVRNQLDEPSTEQVPLFRKLNKVLCYRIL